MRKKIQKTAPVPRASGFGNHCSISIKFYLINIFIYVRINCKSLLLRRYIKFIITLSASRNNLFETLSTKFL